MGRNFTDFLAGAGYFLLDTTREAVLRHDDETAQQEREAGISILTAALYESKTKDAVSDTAGSIFPTRVSIASD